MKLIFFFFFQAEDGIRDYKVTGVQTCALPIYPGRSAATRRPAPLGMAGGRSANGGSPRIKRGGRRDGRGRSRGRSRGGGRSRGVRRGGGRDVRARRRGG